MDYINYQFVEKSSILRISFKDVALYILFKKSFPRSEREKKNICMSVVSVQFISVAVVSDSLRPYELQQARPPCPPVTPGVYSNSCPLSR